MDFILHTNYFLLSWKSHEEINFKGTDEYVSYPYNHIVSWEYYIDLILDVELLYIHLLLIFAHTASLLCAAHVKLCTYKLDSQTYNAFYHVESEDNHL